MSARKRGANLFGWALIALSAVALLALLAAGALLRPPPRDAETLCRTDQPIPAHTVILIDASDSLEPRHAKRLRAAVESERARLAPDGRLSVLAMRPDAPREPAVLFSRCQPARGSEVSALIANPARTQARWDENFGDPLAAAVAKAAKGRPGRESQLAAALTAAAQDPDFSAAIPERRLVLVSDLLVHHQGVFSLYADGASLTGYRATELGAARLPDLSGLTLRMVVLDRPDFEARQAAARTHFWEPWLKEAGATGVLWEP